MPNTGAHLDNVLITYDVKNLNENVYDSYSQVDAVKCLDSLATTFALVKKKRLHFAFAGDSRMRHQYFSFVAV